MKNIRDAISAKSRRAKIDNALNKATATTKPKAATKPKASPGYKVPAKAAAARKATINAARAADLRAIAAKKKKK